MNKEEFIKNLKDLKIEISELQLLKLNQFYKLVIEENEKQNLTRIIEEKDFYLKHFYDSLTLTKIIDLNSSETLCDVGTGAGFPGIVLKIMFPKLKVTLLESTFKKTVFLNKVVEKLELENINVICERAENHRIKYDIVTSRAVAKLNILLELCIPITKKNGYFIAMKANCQNEIIQAEKALKILESKISKIDEFYLNNNDNQRTLIKIKKLNETNGKYPRKFEQIIKNPL